MDFAHLSPGEEALSPAHTRGPGCGLQPAGRWFLGDVRDWAGRGGAVEPAVLISVSRPCWGPSRGQDLLRWQSK